MREAEFREWLEAGGAQTKTGRDSRVYAVRTIEKSLASLGFVWRDLEVAWGDDQFAALRLSLTEMLHDAKAGGQDYRILMPQSVKPQSRLMNWRSWLAQYGRFLAGEANSNRDADKIRRYVLENYIEPAREEGRDYVDVHVRTINDALGLNSAWPNICQALVGAKFLEMAELPSPKQFGADQSSATTFRFALDGVIPAVDPVLSHFTCFPNFARIFEKWPDEQKAVFREAVVAVHAAGLDLFAINKPPYEFRFGRHPLKAKAATAVLGVISGANPQLYVDDGVALGLAVKQKHPLNVANAALFVAALANTAIVADWRPTGSYREGFWPDELPHNLTMIDAGDTNGMTDAADDIGTGPNNPDPTNLILYGPPGTGKTYATAREAVMLCDGFVPDDRAKLMARYDELRKAERIDFVTFHQSLSYEEFVEGLRPPVPGVSEVENDTGSAGLRLEVHRGMFGDIAQRALLDRGEATAVTLDPKRSVFKIALGARGEEEADITEALDNSEISLGWGGNVDWSDAKYDEFSAILAYWQAEFDPQATGKDPNVEQLFAMRSWMQEGDYVIVSDGRDRFRAIGQVCGPYTFDEQAARHPHRRKVRWFWRDDAGLDRSVFYPRFFRRHSLYRLDPAAIDWAALARVVDGDGAALGATQAGSPRPFVLIIDEINRANISKVFGELITLIEPDKRLGKANALTVRLPYSKREFGVPANLHIVGTMNTADRSIALLDTALRRRFRFQEIAPRPDLLPENIAGVPLRRVLAAINQRIEYLIDRDHRIGHALFIGEGTATRAGIDAVMRDKVIPLLQEYFFEDWSRIAAVVGRGFIKETALQPPPGLEGLDPKPSWSVRETFPANAFDVLLGKATAPAEGAEVAEDEGGPETDAA